MLYCIPTKNSVVPFSDELLHHKEFKLFVGIPDINDDIKTKSIVIFDDLLLELNKGSNEMLTSLFLRHSRHLSITVVFISQNIFFQSKNSSFRSISLNCSYYILMKGSRDLKQINLLFNQIFFKKSKFCTAAYNDIMKDRKYAYILLDLNVEQNDLLRVRSNAFYESDEEHLNVVYCEKD